MSGVNIEYKGESIATIPDTGSKTIKTQGKYCEGDILVEYEAPPTPTPTLQSKTVTPTTSQQSVMPDSGYDGLSDVTVNATPLEAKSVTPTAQQQVVTPTAPNIGLSSVTVEGATASIDQNITAGNIKKDVSILGVTGTYEGNPNANLDDYIQGDLKVINTNATAIIPYAFNTTYIEEIIALNATKIGEAAFSACGKLTKVILNDNLSRIEGYAFVNCNKLESINVPSKLSTIGGQAFRNCTSIVAFDMSHVETIPTIFTNTFSSTTFPFYFANQTQLDAYASATNWSALASRFQIKGA